MSDIQTQVYVDLAGMDTVTDVIRALTMAAYHHGNWQKDFTPDMVKPFADRIKEITGYSGE